MTLDPRSFEAGEDVTELFAPAPREPGMVVSVRLGKADAERLMAVANETGRTVSQVAREALHQFLFAAELEAVPAVGMATYYTSVPMQVHGFAVDASAKSFGPMKSVYASKDELLECDGPPPIVRPA